MRSWVIALAALACACNQPAPTSTEHTRDAGALPMADRAGNRMEALVQDSSGRFCTGDGLWCVTDDGAIMHNGEEWARIALYEADRVWPALVRQGGDDARALIGVTTTQTAMYSGGGGEAVQVTLYDVSADGAAPVLSAPLSGQIAIRACFNEDDARARRQACQDQYEFDGRLTLDAGVDSGAPQLVLTTQATTYPGRRSRTGDASSEEPLQEADLQAARDERCSYRRVARRDNGAYVWDAPLPPCNDYLEP